ncbi:hypothetical protein M0R72_16355 [Candidatus Pacearchaeota archaeon]|jgi:hypothetical protein|nr:hypothetical protein [Candidatus Pacearchaeota archaeon]
MPITEKIMLPAKIEQSFSYKLLTEPGPRLMDDASVIYTPVVVSKKGDYTLLQYLERLTDIRGF